MLWGLLKNAKSRERRERRQRRRRRRRAQRRRRGRLSRPARKHTTRTHTRPPDITKGPGVGLLVIWGALGASRTLDADSRERRERLRRRRSSADGPTAPTGPSVPTGGETRPAPQSFSPSLMPGVLRSASLCDTARGLQRWGRLPASKVAAALRGRSAAGSGS